MFIVTVVLLYIKVKREAPSLLIFLFVGCFWVVFFLSRWEGVKPFAMARQAPEPVYSFSSPERSPFEEEMLSETPNDKMESSWADL